VRVKDLPMTPDRVLKALKDARTTVGAGQGGAR
jgi:hypothetical protein